MASFSSSAFLTDAFSDQAFDFGAPTPVTTTTGGHFGGRRKKHREEDVSHSRQARERLRESIRSAIEGPAAPAVEAALARFARPQATDSQYLPLLDRIDYDSLAGRIAEIEALIATAIEDDEDEDILLLI